MHSIDVEWVEPRDGGDEIYEYILQLASYEVKWQPDTDDFYDDFRPWRTVHEGTAKVMSFAIGGLKLGNRYKLRMRAKNSEGPSRWSDELELETPDPAPGEREPEVVPKSWLRMSVPDVMAECCEQAFADGRVRFGGSDFVLEMGTALQPHVGIVRNIFKIFAAMGTGAQSATEMSKFQFGKFCRDVGILDGKRRDGTSNGCKTMHMGEVDLLFQRVNAKNLQSRSKAWAAAQGLAEAAAADAEEIAAKIAEESGGLSRGKEEEDDGGSIDCMGQREFVTAIVRLAWQCFPKLSSIGARIHALLDTVVLPMLEKALEKNDPLAAVLDMPRCKAVRGPTP